MVAAKGPLRVWGEVMTLQAKWSNGETRRVALELMVPPSLLVRATEYWPLSASTTLASVKQALVAPPILPPLTRLAPSFRHLQLRAPVPVTQRVTFVPGRTVWLPGCVTIIGGPQQIAPPPTDTVSTYQPTYPML